jgi:hypothetical protein
MTSVCEIMENYFGEGIETTPTSSMFNAHGHLREAWPVRVPDEVRGYSHHRFCPGFRPGLGPLVRSSSQLQRTQRGLAGAHREQVASWVV